MREYWPPWLPVDVWWPEAEPLIRLGWEAFWLGLPFWLILAMFVIARAYPTGAAVSRPAQRLSDVLREQPGQPRA